MSLYGKLPRDMIQKSVRHLEPGESGFVDGMKMTVDAEGYMYIDLNARVYHGFGELLPFDAAPIRKSNAGTLDVYLRSGWTFAISDPGYNDVPVSVAEIIE